MNPRSCSDSAPLGRQRGLPADSRSGGRDHVYDFPLREAAAAAPAGRRFGIGSPLRRGPHRPLLRHASRSSRAASRCALSSAPREGHFTVFAQLVPMRWVWCRDFWSHGDRANFTGFSGSSRPWRGGRRQRSHAAAMGCARGADLSSVLLDVPASIDSSWRCPGFRERRRSTRDVVGERQAVKSAARGRPSSLSPFPKALHTAPTGQHVQRRARDDRRGRSDTARSRSAIPVVHAFEPIKPMLVEGPIHAACARIGNAFTSRLL